MTAADADLSGLTTLMTGKRATILLALMGGDSLSASEVARRAGISPSLASSHLAKLRAGGLVSVRAEGRRRHYHLAGPHVADVIEHLLTLAPTRAVGSNLRAHTRAAALARARTCYDHLAGDLGVRITDAMGTAGLIDQTSDAYDLRPAGIVWLATLGIDADALRRGTRAFTRPCLDWTERRPHLAGAVGAAIAAHFLDREWVTRLPRTRAVRLTPAGQAALRQHLGLSVDR